MSTCLLITAGLLLHSYVNVMRVAPGFETERILAVDLSLPGTQYRDDAQKVAFF